MNENLDKKIEDLEKRIKKLEARRIGISWYLFIQVAIGFVSITIFGYMAINLLIIDYWLLILAISNLAALIPFLVYNE